MQPSARYCHGDYTVGWISALPLEMAAAEAMLDEMHQALTVPPHDKNAYTLGEIAGHKIVIACLPSGQYGTTSAAVAAQQMLSTFPCIRFGLLVGIAGGIPSETVDIQLGDVVVSTPTGTHAGVIQYDSGKAYPGHFERTGMLNRPPELLLTAVSKLRSKILREGSMLQKTLSQMVEKNPQMSKAFGFCGLQDQLFNAHYPHLESESTCERCDRSQLVPRKHRPSSAPKIHYGLIASANQVVKDAVARDKLGRELGAYCVEMEAAGLMNHFPCLVVRGICDYADSHKNKEWQGYAAATAAAYTKELLTRGHIPSSELSAKGKRWIHQFLEKPRDNWLTPSDIHSPLIHLPGYHHAIPVAVASATK
ncbi:purine and uridine phosphorylase [Aspergillus sclerotiicarbonarius CBS 121057]|uniref:Purine and uridine phosphorylase n=1 Tax=Aspergillus sclerotiicarbonarius (strain CBS 121057 / IBT 28362) TaxID=1448318 RepID=A0A319EP77_ASPSB|nr:purine and uridine phosphorylase [Aspergillus sclerotiicarbonarius CBS 121057]